AARAPRVARKEPGRRVREQKRTAPVREPPPAADRRREEPPVREPRPPAADRRREAPAVRPAEGVRADQGDGGAQAEAVSGRLAARLAALRSERGWSLQDLAQRSGVSRSNLSRIERGEISPTADVLVRL